MVSIFFFFFFQAEDGIRDLIVTGVQTCALPISPEGRWPPWGRCSACRSVRRSRTQGRSPPIPASAAAAGAVRGRARPGACARPAVWPPQAWRLAVGAGRLWASSGHAGAWGRGAEVWDRVGAWDRGEASLREDAGDSAAAACACRSLAARVMGQDTTQLQDAKSQAARVVMSLAIWRLGVCQLRFKHAHRRPRPLLPCSNPPGRLARAQRQPAWGGAQDRGDDPRRLDPRELGPDIADLLPVASGRGGR